MTKQDVTQIVLCIEGAPTAWKRPAQVRGSTARFDSQAESKNTHSIIAMKQILSWHEEMGIRRDARAPLFSAGTPIAVSFVFAFERPYQPKTDFPTKSDLDNLIKYHLDMLQSAYMKGVLCTDDREVAKLTAEKIWAPKSSTTIIISKGYTT